MVNTTGKNIVFLIKDIITGEVLNISIEEMYDRHILDFEYN